MNVMEAGFHKYIYNFKFSYSSCKCMRSIQSDQLAISPDTVVAFRLLCHHSILCVVGTKFEPKTIFGLDRMVVSFKYKSIEILRLQYIILND